MAAARRLGDVEQDASMMLITLSCADDVDDADDVYDVYDVDDVMILMIFMMLIVLVNIITVMVLMMQVRVEGRIMFSRRMPFN